MAEFGEITLNLCRNGVDLSTRQMALAHVCAVTPAALDRQTNRLAILLKVNKPSITRAADRLEECGLLQRDRVESDRRLCVLTLTKKGHAFVKAMNEGGIKARLIA